MMWAITRSQKQVNGLISSSVYINVIIFLVCLKLKILLKKKKIYISMKLKPTEKKL